MTVSEEDKLSAQNDQKKYWDNLVEQCEFCVDTDITEQIINDIFSLSNYTDYNHWKMACEIAVKDKRQPFAKYWASRYISHHLNYIWIDDFKSARKTLDEKKSNKTADDARLASRKRLKEKYP